MPVYTNAGGGGGLDTDNLTATTADVLKGKTAGVKGNDEPVTGTLELTGNAADSTVLSGKTYYNTDVKTKRTGTMANQGAKTAALNCGGSYTIPAGYHNGAGKVTANSLASQTSGTAVAGNILSGRTAWVNGTKITGTMPNRGQAQSGGFGEADDYYAINAMPEGAYFSSGANWAPEGRCKKDTVRNYLGVSADKIVSGQCIAGIWGNARKHAYYIGSASTNGKGAYYQDPYGNKRLYCYPLEVNLGFIPVLIITYGSGGNNGRSTCYWKDNKDFRIIEPKDGVTVSYHVEVNGWTIGTTIRIPVLTTGSHDIIVAGYY